MNAHDPARLLTTYAPRVAIHRIAGALGDTLVAVATSQQLVAAATPLLNNMPPNERLIITDQIAIGSFVTNKTHVSDDPNGTDDAMNMYHVTNGKIDATWTFGDAQPANASASQAAPKSVLRNLVTSEEAFFADSTRYTSSLTRLQAVPGLGAGLQLPPGFSLVALTAKPDSWTATIESSSMTCGVAVMEKNPVAPNTAEGEPICVGK